MSRPDGSWLPFRLGSCVVSEFDGFRLPFRLGVGSTPTADAGRTVRGALAAVAGQRVLLPPGVGVDVDDVAVLGEAVDERDDASSAGEHCAPLLE